jgi:hypothetical protein
MKITTQFAILPFAATVLSCASSRPGIPPIPLQDKLAVVSVHFDGFSDASAAPDESRRKEHGPGLDTHQDPASLADEQMALDSVWARFGAGLPAALGASIEPPEEVVSNPAYAQIPANDSSRSKGLEPSGGLKSVSLADAARLQSLSQALGASRLLFVECWADYDTAATTSGNAAPVVVPAAPPKTAKDSTKLAKDTAKFANDSDRIAKVAADSAKAAPKPVPVAHGPRSVKVVLHVVLRFYQVGKGVYWTGRYLASTKASAGLQAGRVPSSFLPAHLEEAVNPILMRISQDVAIGRGMSD